MKTEIKYREGQMSLKQFYSISYVGKKKYIQFLLTIPEETRSELDKYILNTYHKTGEPEVKFLTLI